MILSDIKVLINNAKDKGPISNIVTDAGFVSDHTVETNIREHAFRTKTGYIAIYSFNPLGKNRTLIKAFYADYQQT